MEIRQTSWKTRSNDSRFLSLGNGPERQIRKVEKEGTSKEYTFRGVNTEMIG